ncbi:MAG: transglutaminase-like domain-containing protein [Gemmataceae bacterium]
MLRLALGLVCLMAGLAEAAGPPVSHLDWARAMQGRMAYGMYFRSKKVGWVVEEMKVTQVKGVPALISSSHTYMLTLFDGEKSLKEETSSTTYALDGVGPILQAESVRKDDGKEVQQRVERVKDGLRIVTKQGGREITRTVPSPRDTIAHHRQLEGWLQGNRKAGDLFNKYSTSWEEEDVDSKQVYHYKERKEILFGGLPTLVHSVTINLDGGKLDAVIFSDTRTLSGTMGGLLTLKLEPEKEARRMDGKPVDLMPVTSVIIDREIGRARDVDALKIEVEGLGDFKVPASHRQVVTASKNGLLVELKRDFRVEKPAPLTEKQRSFYTRSTPRLQSDQELVKNQARAIVGEEKNPTRAAQKIENWVYKTLRKSYSDNAETALEILDTKAGDCTEHALLFVALCRAAGIPAREVGGLAYLRGFKPLFGWHAWAEFHDGHQWVSVDPTWHQVQVDGTHLKMSTGERDLAWTNVIGTLKIKVVDVKTRK